MLYNLLGLPIIVINKEAGGGVSGVSQVNGKTGSVTLYGSDVSISNTDSTKLNAALAGKIAKYSTMPTASSLLLGQIVQYTGTTDSTYTNGYFYQCIQDASSNYIWSNKLVQTAGSQLFYITATPTLSGSITGTFNKTAALMRAALTLGKQLVVKLTDSGTDYVYTLFYVTDDTDTLILGFVRSVSGTTSPADQVLLWYSNSSSYNIHARLSLQSFRLYLMPTAGSEYANRLYQYCGVTSSDYTEGHFYKITGSLGSYVWSLVSLAAPLLTSSAVSSTNWNLDSSGYTYTPKAFVTKTNALIDAKIGTVNTLLDQLNGQVI